MVSERGLEPQGKSSTENPVTGDAYDRTLKGGMGNWAAKQGGTTRLLSRPYICKDGSDRRQTRFWLEPKTGLSTV